MNVLHLISGRGPTGPAAAAMLDVKALQAAGHRAYLATRSGTGLMDACKAEDVPAVGGLRLGKGPMRLLRLPHDMRVLRTILRELAIDTVHVHRSDDQFLAAMAIGRTVAARLIRTWHRNLEHVPGLLLARLARQVDGCVTVSRDAVKTLQSRGAAATEFIPVGVDTDVFKPGGLHGGAYDQTQGPRIGQVGRWKRDRDGRDRGQRAALDVFAGLPRGMPWEGVLIGRGELAAELRHTAYTELNLPESRVTLQNVPVQSPRHFAAVLSALSLGLVFRTGGDGTSRAAAELLACGVPLLVADIPGLRELADENSAVIRLLPDDPHGWARQIESLLKSPERLREMRLTARTRAESTHALKVRGRTLADFYARL
jgi:glycosyltransferase involved in cell wall biosynthesis